MKDEIIEKLKEILSNHQGINVDTETLTPQTPFFDGGLEMDSFAVVEMVGNVEQAYGIEFSELDFMPENFASMEKLAEVIERLRTA